MLAPPNPVVAGAWVLPKPVPVVLPNPVGFGAPNMDPPVAPPPKAEVLGAAAPNPPPKPLVGAAAVLLPNKPPLVVAGAPNPPGFAPNALVCVDPNPTKKIC